MTPKTRLPKDWHEFIDLLNSNHVEYVIVGAWALSIHSKPRFSGDIDFFIRPSLENAGRVVAALNSFGFSSLNVTVEQLALPDKRLMLGNEPCRIDLMTGITGVSFDEAWQNKIVGKLDGKKLPFIGIKELLKNKYATKREKDLVDAKELEKFISSSKSRTR